MAHKPSQRNESAAKRSAGDRRWASVQAAAVYVGVHRQTIREWIAAGKITGYRMNARLVRVDLNEVDAAMKPFGGAA